MSTGHFHAQLWKLLRRLPAVQLCMVSFPVTAEDGHWLNLRYYTSNTATEIRPVNQSPQAASPILRVDDLNELFMEQSHLWRKYIYTHTYIILIIRKGNNWMTKAHSDQQTRRAQICICSEALLSMYIHRPPI